MKKLILIRHGEAEPETSEKSDYDRDLTNNGKRETAKMAALLLNNIPVPGQLVSSTAVRALSTAHIFAATFGVDDVKTSSEIYEASAETLLKVVNQLSNDHEIICLVGHNPGVSNLLYKLTGKITTMPTSAWAEVDFDAASWAEISADTGRLLQYQHS